MYCIENGGNHEWNKNYEFVKM